jgi:hypothetical protein
MFQIPVDGQTLDIGRWTLDLGLRIELLIGGKEAKRIVGRTWASSFCGRDLTHTTYVMNALKVLPMGGKVNRNKGAKEGGKGNGQRGSPFDC